MSSKVLLADIVTIGLGQTFRSKAETSAPSNIKLIQIRDVQKGVIITTDHLAYANTSQDKLKVQVQMGDLLLPLRGSRYEMALFGIENPDTLVTAPNQIAIIRTTSSKVRPEYLLWYFNSPIGQHALNSISSSGSTMSSINRTSLSKLLVDLPSIEQQEDIITIQQNWYKRQHALEQLLSKGEELAERLCLDVIDQGGEV